uniref:Uncharacterized protein n=1 Tax=Brugia malayi TaxID=6279 RepID=A8QFZ1_BRUMA
MSATIIRPAKEKLEALLKEIQEMDLTPSEQMLTREETRQQHEARKRIIEERIIWKITVEATGRILRQLEAIGENLEESSIEIIIENKLPAWILGRVYQQKEQEICKTDPKKRRSQSFDIMKEQRKTKSKIGPRTNQRYFTKETSALTVIAPQTHRKANTKISKT